MALEYLAIASTPGQTMTIEVVRLADSARYDWADATFKSSGWTTRLGALLEDAVTPGLYRGSVEIGAWLDGTYELVFMPAGGTEPLSSSKLTVLSGAAAPAAPVAGIRLITLEELKRYLGIAAGNTSQDALLTDLIDAATADIETYCQKAFVARTITAESALPPNPHDRRFDTKLFLRRYPIRSVSQIVDDSGFVIPATEYDVRGELGYLYRAGGWLIPLTANGVPSRWRVTYEAGHWVDTSQVDAAIKLACKLLVAWYRDHRAPGVQSKSMGQVSVSYAQTGPFAGDSLPSEVLARIGPWASRDI